jgi:membrane-bound ClpP family serine protease
MENEMYEISPNSGRLRKRIKYKKHKAKKSFFKSILEIFKSPIFVFIIVLITGVILYYSLQEPAKKSGKSPTVKSVIINDRLKEDRTE